MAPRGRAGHRTVLVVSGVAGLLIIFRAIVNGPVPARAAPDQPAQVVVASPFDQPPFSNFGQGENSPVDSFQSQPDLRTTVS